jgi:transposase
MTATLATSRHHTVRNIADRFGVTLHVVLAWIARGELRAVNVAVSLTARRPTWRIAEEAVRDFERLRSPHAAMKTKPPPKSKSKAEIRWY